MQDLNYLKRPNKQKKKCDKKVRMLFRERNVFLTYFYL